MLIVFVRRARRDHLETYSRLALAHTDSSNEHTTSKWYSWIELNSYSISTNSEQGPVPMDGGPREESREKFRINIFRYFHVFSLLLVFASFSLRSAFVVSGAGREA